MRIILLVLLALLTIFSLSFVNQASAQEVEHKEVVTVPKDKTINQDYFATGEKIVIAGTVNGDAYIFGGNLIVDGTINGDLIAAGGNVTIRGKVAEDVRLAGGQVNIFGDIAGNLTVGAGNVHVAEQANIAGSIVAGSGNINLFGPLGRGATVGAGNLTFGDSVGGNVTASVGYLTLLPEAKINGDLTYWSDKQADIQSGATVFGKTTFNETQMKEKGKEAGKILAGADIGFKIYSFVVSLVIGFLFIRFLPIFTQKVANQISEKPLASLGFGLLAAIAVPILAIIVAITIIGIPIAVILLISYVIELCLAKIFTAIALGNLIVAKLEKRKWGMFMGLLCGLIVYYLLSIIPFIGFLTALIFTLSGFGALIISKANSYKLLRSRKLI